MSVTKLNYTYEKFDPTINKTIAFRPVDLQSDLTRIHKWMNKDHVIPFWNLGFELEQMQQHLEIALADKHQTLYIGYLDNQPMSYWESYWTIDDIVAGHYPAQTADQGVHLLIGEPEFLGKGYALPLLRAMTFFQFQKSATQKIVTEPDVRNKKMIHIFEKCGFQFQKEIELPDKCGALMFCDRQLFFQRWKG
ncbi:GNAT family N-acetyltransferase [Nodularia harveyana UHCC-0300]|uniref:Lysine N-acyltransferase MbtK n=1 Tax=Nodularia harveyana UHCC-0300 TaxID=2974287 RepID=A0ABU5UJ98_9CYAN|nr:GNAT family N-acetyltransferase [Nodularia harveyana]MEA5583643.1 GNAT family N-acetyltransferase [Nodularia harveyana UHCC-0300]